MKVKLEKFNINKTYMFPSGQMATKEKILLDYPAVEYFTFVAETDVNGEVLFALDNLSGLRCLYGIDDTLTEDEAIIKLQEIRNTEPEQEISAEERIASVLEFQNMMSLPDEEVSGDSVEESV